MKFIFSILLSLFFARSQAQYIERRVINSIGTTYSSNGIILKTSGGEAIVGDYINDSGSTLSQGFFTGFTGKPVTDPGSPIQHAPYGYSIFPNPVKDQLHFRGSFNAVKQVQFYDLAGHCLLIREINLTGMVNVQQLPAGFYIARLVSKADETIVVFKIIKL